MGPNIGETWGISGTVFLVVYALVAIVVLVLGLSARRSIGAGRPVGADALQSRPEDVAYLNGGPELAVWSALSAMHVDGSIATSGPGSSGIVHATGSVPHGGSTLQRAIHALSPAMRPDWGAVGAGGAALSVGVFGVGALLAAEPAFAAELEAQRSAAMGGGTSWSGGYSGDSGFSGGSFSGSGDGGGGGGGCGGGGCGGGGCGG